MFSTLIGLFQMSQLSCKVVEIIDDGLSGWPTVPPFLMHMTFGEIF